MNKFYNICKTFRVVLFYVKHRPLYHKSVIYRPTQTTPAYGFVNFREMAQKSITSFFIKTPKKSADELLGKTDRDTSFNNEELGSKESSVTNGNKMRSSKRLSESEEPASPKASKRLLSSISSDNKRKVKRQRIESSESESKGSIENGNNHETSIKMDQEPKTYPSPKTKKSKQKQSIKQELTSPNMKENLSINDKNASQKNTEEKNMLKGKKKLKDASKRPNKSLLANNAIKEELSSPEEKKGVNGEADVSSVTEEQEEVKPPSKKKNALVLMTSKASKHGNGVDSETGDSNTVEGMVAETEYNPAKFKYHPVKDACWRAGQPVPYLALARTLEAIEGTSGRLRMVDILANYLRSVVALTPEDLLPSIYLCLNQLAPAYHNIELGIAETYLMKAVGQCTGRSLSHVRSAARRAGDLGLVAESSRATQRTMRTPPPLCVRALFQALKDIALMTGHASVNKKISKIQSLYVACRHAEARYLIRSLEGKLRVGLAEQSVLQALAQALATDARGEQPAAGDRLKARVDKYALIIKTTYCECPNYDLLVPVLLQHGVDALPLHCPLTPGVPLKPMLAHPTRGVLEIFSRFENEQFTCEYKYDGERAQIHVPAAPAGGPDLARAAIFSRSQEDNTSKYPDILSRLDALLGPGVTSCVLDCEAVAYDRDTKQILPFQVLSTRKRKDAAAAAISVQVCVFVFDLLYLNGRALVREPLAERRRLLRNHLRETEGTWQFAKSRDCTTTEEVQQFLEEAVRGCCEGLMVKTLRGDHARYDIARRSRNWLKLKKDYLEGVGDTIDVVVIGGYWGRGKRSGVFGGFLLACYDPSTEEYQSLCKIGTGFSDDDLRTLSETLQQHVIDTPPNYYRYDGAHAADAWFAAACVWEVRCADLSLSPAHRAAAGLLSGDRGVSLRFPRFIRARPDKAPEQATSAQQLADLYRAQDQVRAHPARAAPDDDFY